MEIENARPIVYKDKIFDKYLITNDGRVYSCTGKKWVKLYSDKDGYLRINLSNGKRGDVTSTMVAQLVLYTYVGQPPENMEHPTANHIDGNRTNNMVSNLEWMEHSTNSSIRFNKASGSQNGGSKLTDYEVHIICKLLQTKKFTLKDLANAFGVSSTAIRDIYRHDSWKDISCQYSF